MPDIDPRNHTHCDMCDKPLTGKEFYFCVVCSEIEQHSVPKKPTRKELCLFTDMEVQWFACGTYSHTPVHIITDADIISSVSDRPTPTDTVVSRSDDYYNGADVGFYDDSPDTYCACGETGYKTCICTPVVNAPTDNDSIPF
jgi:hypothetical protein